MQGNESTIYQVNKIHMPNQKNAETALLSVERAQKLDLLIHLITNLKQSLVICGANGIGKTTLLEQLIKCNKDALPLLSIQASANLSFENFQDQLVTLLLNQLDLNVEGQDSSAILSVLEKINQNIVVIIDNAGQLVPGLIDSLIQYANVNTSLRIVFSLTLDELQVKNSSDRMIQECHFIDIPPLTEKQCGAFLRKLSSQPNAKQSINEIDNQWVNRLYRKTDGIPGKIISEISKESTDNSSNIMSYKWVGLAVITALAFTLGGFIFFDDEPESKKIEKDNNSVVVARVAAKVEIESPSIRPEPDQKINSVVEQSVNNNNSDPLFTPSEPLLEREIESGEIDDFQGKKRSVQNEEIVEIALPEIQSKISEKINETQTDIAKGNNLNSDVSSMKSDDFSNDQGQVKEARKSTDAIKRVIKIEPEVVPEKIEEQTDHEGKTRISATKIKDKTNKKPEIQRKSVTVSHHDDDSDWVLKQPDNYYTMQLIILSERESVMGFLQEYPDLTDNLKFFKKRKRGGVQYVVIYGSFKDMATASKKMKSLPARYRKAWVREFSGLQKLIRK